MLAQEWMSSHQPLDMATRFAGQMRATANDVDAFGGEPCFRKPDDGPLSIRIDEHDVPPAAYETQQTLTSPDKGGGIGCILNVKTRQRFWLAPFYVLNFIKQNGRSGFFRCHRIRKCRVHFIAFQPHGKVAAANKPRSKERGNQRRHSRKGILQEIDHRSFQNYGIRFCSRHYRNY